jgi:hypothetical protein
LQVGDCSFRCIAEFEHGKRRRAVRRVASILAFQRRGETLRSFWWGGGIIRADWNQALGRRGPALRRLRLATYSTNILKEICEAGSESLVERAYQCCRYRTVNRPDVGGRAKPGHTAAELSEAFTWG